jgi:hypothetical protein
MEISVSIDSATIEKAKKYASGSGTSLEEMIDNYIKLLATRENKINAPQSAIARALKGVVHSQMDISQLLNDDLENNHRQ